MGTQLPCPKGATPQFSTHARCGQTAGLTKMLVGMEVGLDPGDFVLDGDPAPPQGTALTHPIFGPYLLWPNGWMDEDATWYGSRPRPMPHYVRREPIPPANGAQQPPPLFGPCLLWSRSPISATAELLFKNGGHPLSLIFKDRYL